MIARKGGGELRGVGGAVQILDRGPLIGVGFEPVISDLMQINDGLPDNRFWVRDFQKLATDEPHRSRQFPGKRDLNFFDVSLQRS